MGIMTHDQLAVLKLHDDVIDSFNKRDADKLLSLHADNIILMEQNMPILYGKKQVATLFNKLKDGDFDFDLSFNVQEIEIAGRRAFVRGQVIKTVVQKNGAIDEIGKFISLLQKQTDGTWLRTHVIANSDMPV